MGLCPSAVFKPIICCKIAICVCTVLGYNDLAFFDKIGEPRSFSMDAKRNAKACMKIKVFLFSAHFSAKLVNSEQNMFTTMIQILYQKLQQS